MWTESTAKGGVKQRRISSIYTLNLETKSILFDTARVNLESSGIFFCVFLGFGYKIIEKPQIPSDNLDPASSDFTDKEMNKVWTHSITPLAFFETIDPLFIGVELP